MRLRGEHGVGVSTPLLSRAASSDPDSGESVAARSAEGSDGSDTETGAAMEVRRSILGELSVGLGEPLREKGGSFAMIGCERGALLATGASAAGGAAESVISSWSVISSLTSSIVKTLLGGDGSGSRRVGCGGEVVGWLTSVFTGSCTSVGGHTTAGT